MNIVLIETSGNQRYIFATNKLRENVGASELTYRVGTETVLKAVDKEKRFENDDEKSLWEADDLDGRKLRANLLNKKKNPELVAGGKIEVVTATSGKALLLVESADIGRNIIKSVTEDALREMPGLTVHGAISKGFDSLCEKDDEDDFKLHKAIVEVHHRLEEIRYRTPSNEQRFLRLPFVAPCETSGLPASEGRFLSKDEKGKNEAHRFSNVALSKRDVLRRDKSAYEKDDKGKPSRIVGMIQRVFNINLYKNLERLENDFKDLSWIAVIHADGNGLGEVFQNFDDHTGLKDNKCTPRDYIGKYRRFSLALDVCTINATGQALENLRQRFLAEEEESARKEWEKITKSDKFVPVVPLILGGDDLTVISDGQYALKFVYEFLRQFEKETNKITEYSYLKEDCEGKPLVVEGETVFEILTGIVREIAHAAFDVPHLGICAGVAIVKPHFPFHQAYELAEELLKSAKQVKENIKSKSKGEQYPCSALDYHILYDSTASRLEEIRGRLKVDEGHKTWLFARPYVVSNFDDLANVKDTNWLTPRKWDELEKRVVVMLAKDDDDKRKLPNSQLHSLREALFLGKDEAEARTRLVNRRYNEYGFDELLWDEDAQNPNEQDQDEHKKDYRRMFFKESHEDDDGFATHFLDALDIVEFRKGEEVVKIEAEKEVRYGLRDKRSNNTAKA